MRWYPQPYPQSWQLLRKTFFLVIWLHYTGIKLRRVRFPLMSKLWILCVPYHGKLWLGFHMNNSVCCSYAFCCQQNCHILGFYRLIKKGTLLKMYSFNWEKGFRLQLSPVSKCCLEDWLFYFLLDQSIPMLPFFYNFPPHPTPPASECWAPDGAGTFAYVKKQKKELFRRDR